jgi:hypothetical protein
MAEKKPHSKLSDFPKKDPFKAPEGYFDNLQSKIDARIGQETKGKVIHVNWKYIGYAVAASVTLLVAVLIGIRNPAEQKPTAEEMVAAISFDDCLAYLKSSDIEVEEIVAGTPLDAWIDPIVSDTESDSLIGDKELDLLYERYGVTDDENLQIL